MPKLQIEIDQDKLELLEVFQEFSDAVAESTVYELGLYIICVDPEYLAVYLVLPLPDGYNGDLSFKWGCYELKEIDV
jgi:hypothetical protein